MISTDDLFSVTSTCWETLLRLPLEPAPPAVPDGPLATIAIRGAFGGSVELALSQALAERAARIVLEQDDVEPQDVVGAVLELTNIVGGNVKALLPQPSSLGLPATAPGSGRLLEELHARCDGEPVVVRLRATPSV